MMMICRDYILPEKAGDDELQQRCYGKMAAADDTRKEVPRRATPFSAQ